MEKTNSTPQLHRRYPPQRNNGRYQLIKMLLLFVILPSIIFLFLWNNYFTFSKDYSIIVLSIVLIFSNAIYLFLRIKKKTM